MSPGRGDTACKIVVLTLSNSDTWAVRFFSSCCWCLTVFSKCSIRLFLCFSCSRFWSRLAFSSAIFKNRKRNKTNEWKTHRCECSFTLATTERLKVNERAERHLSMCNIPPLPCHLAHTELGSAHALIWWLSAAIHSYVPSWSRPAE